MLIAQWGSSRRISGPDRDPSGSIRSPCSLIGALVAQQWGFLGSIEGGHCCLLVGLFRPDGGGGRLRWLGWSLWIKMTPCGPITSILVGIQGTLLTRFDTKVGALSPGVGS